MNLSQLEALVAIAETGSFTEAAERVGLTRSALSHALANLEAELGVTLLERKRGGALPTTVGNCMLRNAREILANIEIMQQEAAKARGLQAGKLRIGIVTSISPVIWGAILRKFHQEYPGIEVITFEGTGHEVENWILDCIVDVGYVLRPQAGIDSVFIGRDEVRVLVPSGHSLRNHQSVQLEQIAHEPFILPKIACDFMDASWHGAAYVKVERHYEVTDINTILAMVREGLGFTLLPEMLMPTQVEGLHTLSLEPRLQFAFGIGLRAGRNVSPAARRFVQLARLWASAHGYEDVEATQSTEVAADWATVAR